MAKHTGFLCKIIASIALVFVLYKTLFPFYFKIEKIYPALFLLHWGSSSPWDALLNVLLFVPLGYGLSGCLMQKKPWLGLPSLGVVFLICFGLSYVIDVMQIFQPLRFPSLVDVCSNAAGGVLGAILFRWREMPLTLILSVHVASVFMGSIPLQMQTDLSNWDRDFPLLLGNELSGDRTWEGYVSEVHIADRALSKDELVHVFSEKFLPDSMGDSLLASYTMQRTGSYKDNAGLLPDLVWNGKPYDVQQGKGVFLGPDRWLKSATPAVHLTQKIMESSQFTLIAKVAAAHTEQFGPARIISFSADPVQRNFTLGQEGDDLIFRLRTPSTGSNGTPDMIVRDVFATTHQKNLVISYSGTALRVFVDGVDHSHEFELSPGAVAYNYFFPVDMSFLRGYKILWYAVIFIPLGVLITRIFKVMKRRIVLICGGILLPYLILEGSLAGVSGRAFMPENILAGILLTSGPVVLLKIAGYLIILKETVQVKTL
jgi:VanZ family protein